MESPATKTKTAGEVYIEKIPDCVAHSIIGLLDIEDIASLSAVSRTWRRLCYSTPELNISIDHEATLSYLSGLDYFVHTLLAQRKGLVLKRLLINSFSEEFNSPNRTYVRKVLFDSINAGVQQISLEIPTPRFVLPGFVTKSINMLDLNLYDGVLVLPPAGMVSLTDLTLRRFKISAEADLGEWISTHGKHIKYLSLCHFEGVNHLRISHSNVQNMTVLCNPDCVRDISISAPELLDLRIMWKCEDEVEGSFCRVSGPKLERLTYNSNIVDLVTTLKDSRNLKHVKLFGMPLTRVSKVGQFLCHVPVLSINSHLTQVLYEHKALANMSWKNTKGLEICITPSEGGFKIPALLSLLKALPLLRNLVLRMYARGEKVYDDIDVDCLKQDEGDVPLVNLKKVLIERNIGNQTEIKLVSFIMTKAKDLREVRFWYLQRDDSDFKLVKEHLARCIKTSPRVAISQTYLGRQL